MQMWILAIILFCVGLIEEIVAMMFYKTGAKNFDFLCAIFSFMRGLLWVFVITTLIHHAEENLKLALCYIFGGGIGTYYGLKIEQKLEKLIVKLAHKGRRKKRWFLFRQSKPYNG